MYGAAIRRLQTALRDPIERTSDQTLAAVMLMGTFETIASADVGSMKSFTHHAIAAARCIDVRGPGQFQSEASLQLFLQMRRTIVSHGGIPTATFAYGTNQIMTCHQLQEPVPYALKRWSQWSEHLNVDKLDPANRFSEINETLASIRAKLKHQNIKDPAVVASRLLPIDDMLQTWEATLPPSWRYKSYRSIRSCSATSSSYDTQYDVYPEAWIACVWNSYRNVRLLIHESIVVATLRHGTAAQKANLQASVEVLAAMANGICHSVAYHLGHGRRAGDKKLELQDGVPAPGGFLLLWPLFFSGMLRTTPRGQREWVAKTIRQIGVQMGLRLAVTMARMLEEKALSFSHSDTFLLGEWHPN